MISTVLPSFILPGPDGDGKRILAYKQILRSALRWKKP